MQEVFEKIISKINEKIEHYDSRHKILTDSGMFGDADRIADRMTELDFTREIVKQAAEEFATDTNVGTNGWIPCSSGNLPEENEDVEVTVEEIADEVGGKRHYNARSWLQDGQWVIKKNPYNPNVIAWKYPTEPYQPKGE